MKSTSLTTARASSATMANWYMQDTSWCWDLGSSPDPGEGLCGLHFFRPGGLSRGNATGCYICATIFLSPGKRPVGQVSSPLPDADRSRRGRGSAPDGGSTTSSTRHSLQYREPIVYSAPQAGHHTDGAWDMVVTSCPVR